jgi:polysaccharide chain length determinant protein (PEP-CTERM system associated)
MLGHRELTTQDYVSLLKRRGRLIACSAIVFLVAGGGSTFLLPPEYVSQTLVIIEQQKVPEAYVKPVLAEDMNERLASMKEQIFSRSRIEPLVDSFNLFAGRNRTMEDRIELTRKAINVKPIASARGNMPGFFITFRARDPHTAQRVCGEIESLFVAENLSARVQTAEGTAGFLKQQLAEAKKVLDEQDEKMAAFQRKFSGSLPDQASANANTLQALTTQLDAATQSVNRAQQNATFLEAMVSQQTREQQKFEPMTGATRDDNRAELKRLVQKKQELEAAYTPDHPDVLAVSRQIADLEARIDRAPVETIPPPDTNRVVPDSVEVKQLKAQLRAAQQTLAGAKEEQNFIQHKIRTYEGRIESRPVVEQEYKQLTRDHDTALQFYNSLLTKMNESSMATALEHRQQGEQFRVMDPPNLPESPAFPKRIVFAGGGFAFGLILGLAIAALLEYRDTSLRTELDVLTFTNLPTLGMISHLDTLEAPKSTRAVRRSRGITSLNNPTESAG